MSLVGMMLIALSPLAASLECNTICGEEGEMLCPQTCDAEHNGCLGLFRDVAGEIELIQFGCGTFADGDCEVRLG